MSLQKAYKLFHDGNIALSKASEVGFRLDVEYCKETISKIEKEIELLKEELLDSRFVKRWKEIYKDKFNLGSNHQLEYYLYTVLKYKPVEFTEKGKGSTNDISINKLDIPELRKLIRIRKLSKIKDTYLSNYLREQVDGALHPVFNLNTVISYRPSVNSPNLANVSKHNEEAYKYIRSALIPKKGHLFLEVDYKNLEVYVNTMFHKDPTMFKYLLGGADMHTDMAKQIYMLDSFDKNDKYHSLLRFFIKGDWNFSQAYGSYYVNCAKDFARDLELPNRKWKNTDGIKINDDKTICEHYIEKGITCYKEFENFLKRVEEDYWGKRFPVYRQWRENIWYDYQKKGYIENPIGFKFQGLMRFKNVINVPAQSTAFHILLWALIRISDILEKKKLNSKIILQIYDAIVFDVDPEELDTIKRIIKKVMTKDVEKEFSFINVPLGIDAEISEIDGNWYNMKHIEI